MKFVAESVDLIINLQGAWKQLITSETKHEVDYIAGAGFFIENRMRTLR